jgi:phospholipid transport system substrate-binding protein
MRSLIALLATCFFCVALAVASPSLADDKADANAFADDLGHKALAVILDKSLSKDAKRTRLETLFQENVDIDWIGKFVLGRFWRSATEQQKHDYLTNYKTFLIKHYTSNLSEFTDANFEVVKVVPEERGGNVVTLHLKRANAEDTVVNYTVRKKADGKLNVYDIVVEGVSMITTQRSEFSSVVSQKGLDYLIAELGNRSKTSEKN